MVCRAELICSLHSSMWREHVHIASHELSSGKPKTIQCISHIEGTRKAHQSYVHALKQCGVHQIRLHPADSWKLRAMSVPISGSDHVMIVSSAEASEYQTASKTSLSIGACSAKQGDAGMIVRLDHTALAVVDVVKDYPVYQKRPVRVLFRYYHQAKRVRLLQRHDRLDGANHVATFQEMSWETCD